MPLTSLKNVFKATIEEITERTANGGSNLIGLSTGYAKVDEVTGGLRPDAVYVIAARTGMGKSSLGLNIAENNAKEGNKVLYISLEMDGRLLALRMISSMTMIPALDIEYGRLNTEQLALVQHTQERIKDWSLAILDDTLNVNSLEQRVKEIHEEHQLDLIVLDQLSLVHSSLSESQNARITQVMQTTRKIVRDIYRPCIAIAQLNRETERQEGNIPQLSNLKDSGRIEEDAMVVMFIHRPQVFAQLNGTAEEVRDNRGRLIERDAMLIIAKNRQGPTGRIPMIFYPEEMRWADKEIVQVHPPPSASDGPLAKRLKERV